MRSKKRVGGNSNKAMDLKGKMVSSLGDTLSISCCGTSIWRCPESAQPHGN